MKTLSFSLVLLFSGALLACESKDNQILGNKMAGTWTAEQIRFKNPYRPTTDSTARLSGASITFDACTFKGEESIDCPGKYQLTGKQKVPFLFMARGKNQELLSFKIAASQSSDEFGLSGLYNLSFSDNNLRLEMKGYITWNDGSGKGNFSDPTAYLTLVKQP